MDIQKTKKVSCTKGSVALIAALSCLVIYILACVSSPATWSPDSSKIAILVTPPGDNPDQFAIFTYDISTGERVLLDEVKADGVLSAPSWSPDGKWIAYYRVEPSPPAEPPVNSQSDPNTRVLADEDANNIRVEKTPGQAEPKEVAEALFSEENKVLPNILFDLVEESISKEEEETFNVKLMVVSPDGKEKKVLTTIQFVDDSDARTFLMVMQPDWSKDSKTLFYARLLDSEDLYYIGSFNIDSGEAYAHLFSSAGSFSLSSDGKWIASLLKNESEELLLNIIRVDGIMQKYFKLDLNIDREQLPFLQVSWSRDSKYILISVEKGFVIIDTVTGSIEKYSDPNTEMVAWHTFSPDSRKVYYLAGYEVGEPNSTEEKTAISSIALEDKKVKVVTFLPKLDGDGLGQLSISPNGKMVMVRSVIEDEQGKGTALIFWDGKTQQVIKTDYWLITPDYTEDDLIFEEKLIGQWIGKDGRSLVLEGAGDMTYRMTVADGDKKESPLAANLVKLNDMLFLAIFRDESVLQEMKSHGLYFFPDMLMKIDEIEPKLLLLEVDHDEISELLNKDPNSLKQETEKAGYIFEGIRL